MKGSSSEEKGDQWETKEDNGAGEYYWNILCIAVKIL